VARNYHPPPFSNFLFTYLFSIKFLYFVIIKFHLFFPYFNLFLSIFMYKIVNNLVDVHAEHILTPSDNRSRGNAAYRTLYTNADVYRYSIFPRTIITWNTIPPTLRQINTIDQFQAGLGSITLPVLSQM
jgi:hypothetical protein